ELERGAVRRAGRDRQVRLIALDAGLVAGVVDHRLVLDAQYIPSERCFGIVSQAFILPDVHLINAPADPGGPAFDRAGDQPGLRVDRQASGQAVCEVADAVPVARRTIQGPNLHGYRVSLL